jgi:hypothetical protein
MGGRLSGEQASSTTPECAGENAIAGTRRSGDRRGEFPFGDLLLAPSASGRFRDCIVFHANVSIFSTTSFTESELSRNAVGSRAPPSRVSLVPKSATSSSSPDCRLRARPACLAFSATRSSRILGYESFPSSAFWNECPGHHSRSANTTSNSVATSRILRSLRTPRAPARHKLSPWRGSGLRRVARILASHFPGKRLCPFGSRA